MDTIPIFFNVCKLYPIDYGISVSEIAHREVYIKMGIYGQRSFYFQRNKLWKTQWFRRSNCTTLLTNVNSNQMSLHIVTALMGHFDANRGRELLNTKTRLYFFSMRLSILASKW